MNDTPAVNHSEGLVVNEPTSMVAPQKNAPKAEEVSEDELSAAKQLLHCLREIESLTADNNQLAPTLDHEEASTGRQQGRLDAKETDTAGGEEMVHSRAIEVAQRKALSDREALEALQRVPGAEMEAFEQARSLTEQKAAEERAALAEEAAA